MHSGTSPKGVYSKRLDVVLADINPYFRALENPKSFNVEEHRAILRLDRSLHNGLQNDLHSGKGSRSAKGDQ